MKTCSKCKLELDESFFSKKDIKKDGSIRYQTFCKECNKIYNKEHYINNKATYIKKAKIHDSINRKVLLDYVLEYLQDHHCIDCKESDPIVLEFDHRGNKKSSISNMISKGYSSIKLLQEEIDKCDVRCANCHRRKTAKERGYKRFLVLNVPVV